MMKWLYGFLTWLLGPLVLLFTGWRLLHRPAYRAHWWERFGFLPRRHDHPLWVHAVSVGEGMAALPLLKRLQEHYPQLPILVTSTTPTGRARIQQNLGISVSQAYLPYDLPGAVGRFLRRTRPRVGILLETELWPNLLTQAKRTKIPVILLNARLSQPSFTGYQRWRSLFTPILQDLALVAAQSVDDGQRFQALGAKRVEILGQLKLDFRIDATARERARQWQEVLAGRRLWVFASTHPGEEAMAWAALPALRAQFPSLLLVLLPRHPERGADLARALRQAGIPFAQRSRGEIPGVHDAVFLVDRLGELIEFYGASELVWIGGSFLAKGGHNPIEAAAWGKPILVGPHMENFAGILQSMQAAEAILQVSDLANGVEQTKNWLAAPNSAQQWGHRAYSWYTSQGGAVDRALGLLAPYLEEPLSNVPKH
ncbi:MAG: 3-deoxy-D-manno-octulosonic acid transferase [Acidithiobacillus sp.]|nr:3-deoxy-D-manno-octulosonic acid transferase [Acidithiobacillus sp.]